MQRSIIMTVPEIPVREPEFYQGRICMFCCGSDYRSAPAARAAIGMGCNPGEILSGGIAAWKRQTSWNRRADRPNEGGAT